MSNFGARRCVRCGRHRTGAVFSDDVNICDDCRRPQHQFALNGIAQQCEFFTSDSDIEIASYLNNCQRDIANQLQQAIDRHRYFMIFFFTDCACFYCA
jgi:hypothetical protein